ncbi:MAG: hypothetical protein ABIM50_12425 [Novosphingobium sp.]
MNLKIGAFAVTPTYNFLAYHPNYRTTYYHESYPRYHEWHWEHREGRQRHDDDDAQSLKSRMLDAVPEPDAY